MSPGRNDSDDDNAMVMIAMMLRVIMGIKLILTMAKEPTLINRLLDSENEGVHDSDDDVYEDDDDDI